MIVQPHFPSLGSTTYLHRTRVHPFLYLDLSLMTMFFPSGYSDTELPYAQLLDRIL